MGFETRKRVADRLGVKNWRNGFAAGHEPYPMTEPALLALLEMIANGRIAISARVIPFFGLISTKAVVLRDSLDVLIENGYCPLDWLKVLPEMEPSRRIVQFGRW